jgi:methylmalonyl-CoA/ethylmalonyl-CoA epimerase
MTENSWFVRQQGFKEGSMFESIDRIAIAVKDLDKAVDFFSDLLNIDFFVFPTKEGMGMRGAYSACGLELIEPTGPDTMLSKFIENRGEGLWALILKVKNMDEAIKKFEEKGLRQTGDVTLGSMREVGFHPKGSYGVQIILAEYPAEHPATWAALDEKG